MIRSFRKNNDYLWIPNHFPQTDYGGRKGYNLKISNHYLPPFSASDYSRKNNNYLWSVYSKPFSACVYGGKNNNYLWILFVESKPFPANCFWREEQRLFVDSKPFSSHCLWREEQRLFVDSKPLSASDYGGKNKDYLWIPNHFRRLFM